MADLSVISLACMMEVLGIDSENLLWSKPRKDYPCLFPHLIYWLRFNRRRKRLHPYIVKVQEKISVGLEDQGRAMVIDSIPAPVIKLARERTYKVFRKNFETVAKGYSAVNKGVVYLVQAPCSGF